MKKKKTPDQLIKELSTDIIKEINSWVEKNENGCSDPFWTDGMNMNLNRNHIIYAKRQIADLCAEYSIPIPEEMYLPTPPEVSDYYMAHLRDKQRVERVAFGRPERITTKRKKYDREQLSLF